MRRMAMDRCLPQFLLNVNSCRKTNHWIVLGFFLVASSLFLILRGNVETLAGVYNLAFLSVMVNPTHTLLLHHSAHTLHTSCRVLFCSPHSRCLQLAA